MQRDGIEVPGQDRPERTTKFGAGPYDVADPIDGEMRGRPQGSLDLIRDRLLRAGDRFDVHQCLGKRDGVREDLCSQHPASLGVAQDGADNVRVVTITDPAWGIGLATLTDDEQVLDVWFPAGKLGLVNPPAIDIPGNVALSPAESERC